MKLRLSMFALAIVCGAKSLPIEPIEPIDESVDAGQASYIDAGALCRNGTDGKLWCCYDWQCDATSGLCTWANCYIDTAGEEL